MVPQFCNSPMHTLNANQITPPIPASAPVLNWKAILESGQEWEEDADLRYNLPVLNAAFHESVPVLRFIDWRITSVRRGFAETLLPLNIGSTNQYVTHQAALMLLTADYTGGTALSTLFHKVPGIGFHPLHTDYGAYLWGAKATIRWIRPSCDDLVCRAEIEKAEWERIARRFFEGKRVLETITVQMFNGNTLVGESEFTYWAQNSHALCYSPAAAEKPHMLYEHKLRTSARLIAGLRAVEQMKPVEQRLFDDPVAETVAQKRGLVLAQRFSEYMPQLQSMVAARTKSLDDCLSALASERYTIVNVGCGFDTRPWRLNLRNHQIFELDLPLMLQSREIELPANSYRAGSISRVAIDLRRQAVDEVVRAQADFDPSQPVFVFWEGGTMYFQEPLLKGVLVGIFRLLDNPKSRLWFDFASNAAVTDTTGLPEAEAFMRGMRRMGEPFVFGFNDVRAFLAGCGLQAEMVQMSDAYIQTGDPTYRHYGFCVAKRLV
jgi:methyltransferase (TIGR00027 family)